MVEKLTSVVGILMIVYAAGAALAAEDGGGQPRIIGSLGLAVLVVCAAFYGVRLHRAAVAEALPTSVARVAVRIRPSRASNAITVLLSLVLPLAALVAALALFEHAWLLLAGVLLFGCAGLAARELGDGHDKHHLTAPVAAELLERLCMRAGMRVPFPSVAEGDLATAWTAGGRIHITRPLLDLLDDAELEAVLAHELAHIAHRDATTMEICSAPSRLLLAFAGSITRWLFRWVRTPSGWVVPGAGWFMSVMAILTVLCAPPAFVIGWVSRLSVLGSSRAREFSADAAAVTLTGRPSALASALLKLDGQREWAPREDLRQVEPYAVLCIVGTDGPGLGRPFRTHPPTAERVKRLEELEARIHARCHAVRL